VNFVVVNLVSRRLSFWLEGPKMKKVMEDFKQWCGLLNMQGVTDGTHVLISKPSIPYPQDYYYHNLGYSMVAQVMVDSNKKFIDIFIGFPINVKITHKLKNLDCINKLNTMFYFIQAKDVEMEFHITYLGTKGVYLSAKS